MVTKKLLILDFGQAPPESPGCPGLLSSRRVGTRLELVVDGFGEEHLRHIESLSPRTFEIVDLDAQATRLVNARASRRPTPVPDGQGVDRRGRAGRSGPCAKPVWDC